MLGRNLVVVVSIVLVLCCFLLCVLCSCGVVSSERRFRRWKEFLTAVVWAYSPETWSLCWQTSQHDRTCAADDGIPLGGS